MIDSSFNGIVSFFFRGKVESWRNEIHTLAMKGGGVMILFGGGWRGAEMEKKRIRLHNSNSNHDNSDIVGYMSGCEKNSTERGDLCTYTWAHTNCCCSFDDDDGAQKLPVDDDDLRLQVYNVAEVRLLLLMSRSLRHMSSSSNVPLLKELYYGDIKRC